MARPVVDRSQAGRLAPFRQAEMKSRSFLPITLLVLSILMLLPYRGKAADAAPASSGSVGTTSSSPTETLPLGGFAAIGSSFAQSSRLPELGWDETQIDAFIDGVRAALRGKAYPFDERASRVSAEMGRRVRELEERNQQRLTEKFARPGAMEQYMKETVKRHRMQQTDSGLGYRIEAGRGGLRPRPDDSVIFTCIATAADGTTNLPQLSSERVRAKMTDLVPGLLEGMQMMTVDGKATFVLPPALSFADGDWPPRVDRAPLIFQITLQEIIAPDTAP
jgi:FKBP-type peptidyl-prolyl cis-trans isomerase FkpA